jgi:hypothetical protein
MRARRLLGASVIHPPGSSCGSQLKRLRAEVLGQPQTHPQWRSVHTVFQKPLKGEMFMAHWSVPEIWDWPRAAGVEWVDLKKNSIQDKLKSLESRGKGPLMRKKS